jgi:hypothetical protein
LARGLIVDKAAIRRAILFTRVRGSATTRDRTGFSSYVIPSPKMATEHIIALLIQERDKLNRAIEVLQGTKRRGRPPKNSLTVPITAGSGHKKTRIFTAAQKKKQAARMKKYWVARKKEAAGDKR